jgi:DNA-binding CsgD family transcriptional regulator
MNSPKRKAQIKRQNELAKERRSKLPLTKIELQIIQLIYEENTSQEIADLMGKSRRTIDNHRIFIIKKIGCKNVVGIIKYALKKRLVKKTPQRLEANTNS